MAKPAKTSPILLRWSEHVPTSDVQDPLGLSLRGSARLASQLLYCITSITPRARYFSFIPWSIHNFQQREKGQPHALGLRDAVILREQALTLGCVVHHKGRPCDGGGLVGSRQAGHWLAKHSAGANFRKLKPFAKNPALSAYYNSLVNLGAFVTDEERPDTDENAEGLELSFDDLELSSVGLALATRYDSMVGKLAATRQLTSTDRTCTLASLGELGKRGGLCELTARESVDRELLRGVFFGLAGPDRESHAIRRRSLLLILELCGQFSADDWPLDESNFANAVYYGALVGEEKNLTVALPLELVDIATRWRMFYFHHYMAVALEGLLSWLVNQLGTYGLAGTTVDLLIRCLDESLVSTGLSEILQSEVKRPFGGTSPSVLFECVGIVRNDLGDGLGKLFDDKVRPSSPFSERNLEGAIRSKTHRYSPLGLALPLILLAGTLARYSRWETTKYGQWLAGSATDSYLDLIPPVLTMGLSRRFGNWWKCNWQDLAAFVLSRYVVQQHQSMSYEKSFAGDRCILQTDGSKVFSTGEYGKIGMGNLRLNSAIQVLVDLGLLESCEDGSRQLTKEGQRFLERELARETGG